MGENNTAGTWRDRVPSLPTAIHTIGLTAALLLGFAAYRFGLFHNYLGIVIVLATPVMLATRLWALYRKRLVWHLLRHPLDRDSRSCLLRCLNLWVFWSLMIFALHLAVIPVQFTESELFVVNLQLWGCFAILMVLGLFRPGRLGVRRISS